VFIINGNGTIIWSKEYEPGTLPDPDELKIEIEKIDRQKN
jgi:predicted Rdx family selenoprotein|tara:strand:- start:579 stop:698 length:120 start_codon:yes stop_codon:yes gene_type:complete